MEDISKYNIELVKNNDVYTLWHYIINIVPKYFPEYDTRVVLKFITINYREYMTVINTEFMKQYGLLESPKNYIKRYNFKMIVDYTIEDKEYKFTPEAFKHMILHDKRNIYKQYFIFIEKCMCYYMDYQSKVQKKLDILTKTDYKI